MESFTKEKNFSYAIINNIPFSYHSSDLRNYFSQFIESGGFECFHFRHRPEQKVIQNSEKIGDLQGRKNETKGNRTTCCVVKVKKAKLNLFLTMYNRKHWNDNNGDIISQICYISRIKIPGIEIDDAPKLQTRGESRVIPKDREDFSQADLQALPELHPPDLMPNGNVGTPTMIFMDYIKQCRLPPSIIKKLGLQFPKTRTTKMYGSVPLDYGGSVVAGHSDDGTDSNVTTASGYEIVHADATETAENPSTETADVTITDTSTLETTDNLTCNQNKNTFLNTQETKTQSALKNTSSKRSRKSKTKDPERKRRMELNIEEKMIAKEDSSEEDNDSCEEWERHEALYDDPANQERNKQRLFEEEIELKWEKGGSGLVFYTDAQYWHAQEGDFDEQTADDWDVDMSAYYEDGAGDKDARDYLTMRQENRRRAGIEATDRYTAGIAKKRKKPTKDDPVQDEQSIGKFEDHTKGFGRKIMEEQGWKDGQGLGSTITGISDALENEGQHPADKRGFGYRGEKLVRNVGPAKRKVIISTVYDKPTETDPVEPLNRRQEPYHLKYRDEVHFQKSDEILKPTGSHSIAKPLKQS